MLGYNQRFLTELLNGENKEACWKWLNKLSKRERVDLALTAEQFFKSCGSYGLLVSYFETGQSQLKLAKTRNVSQASISRSLNRSMSSFRRLLVKEWRCPHVPD